MSSGFTYVYDGCLGTADWFYRGIYDKVTNTYFIVYSTAKNNQVPLNLIFNHKFFSLKLTKEENDKFIKDLTAILKTINAKNIAFSIINDSPVVQSIYVNYEINGVDQSKVDSLTTTIAAVCTKLIDDIGLKHGCKK